MKSSEIRNTVTARLSKVETAAPKIPDDLRQKIAGLLDSGDIKGTPYGVYGIKSNSYVILNDVEEDFYEDFTLKGSIDLLKDIASKPKNYIALIGYEAGNLVIAAKKDVKKIKIETRDARDLMDRTYVMEAKLFSGFNAVVFALDH